MKATIYDVADTAGLSIATVSRYINGKGSIKEKNKEKILRAIELLNYVPDASAQGLASGLAGAIGLVITHWGENLKSQYLHQFTVGLFQVVQESGADLLLVQMEGDAQKACWDVLTRKRVDGIVFAGTQKAAQKYLMGLYQEKFPMVYAGHRCEWDERGCDIYGGFSGYRKDVIKLLNSRGCKRILCIEETAETAQKMRNIILEEGWQDSIVGLTSFEGFTEEQVHKTLLQWLRREDRPDAVFFIHYRLAGCVYAAVGEAGLSIPKDLKLVSTIHSEEEDGLYFPNTAVVYINAYQMGYQAGKKLIGLVNHTPLLPEWDRVSYEIRLNQTVG